MCHSSYSSLNRPKQASLSAILSTNQAPLRASLSAMLRDREQQTTLACSGAGAGAGAVRCWCETEIVQVRFYAVAELCHVALQDGLCAWLEDFVIGCDRDPHTQAAGVHLAVVIREVTSKREELLGVGLVRKV